jgi:ketosteroid isomerase-like protein
MSSPRILLCLLCLAVVSIPTAKAAPDKAALKAEVSGMERSFCAMAQEQGILAAFKYFAAPDVAFIDTDPRKYRGLAAVVARIGADQPGVKLTWSAMFTDVSDDGTLGYNYGRYELAIKDPEGKSQSRAGFFLTIWKRQPDNSWRYVMDTGAPDPVTKPPATAGADPAAPKKK